MVRQYLNGKRKDYSDYQKISNSVKYPNITIRVWNQRTCENLCSMSSNCYGYSSKSDWCQLLVMNDCCNSTQVLLSDGNFTDLTKPIRWSFNTNSFIPQSGGEAPNITDDDIPDDDLNRTSTTINTSGVTETSTKPQTSDTTKTTATPMCPCVCEDVTQQPPTERELEILKDNLKKELAVDKKKLSKTIRAKTSAPDERRSAQGIGFIGVILLSALPIFIFIIDLPQLYADIKTFYANVSSLCSNRTPR
ncbi:uncharacterized protein LOC106880439 [Octopus bimaculoides]|uniref:Apple domain-containing protein n=1 Tax=Octopus bimaculoides TaxID=37653 RepID=A0A0L8FZ17_OCTBM|nr:uncharacterized protein LOC106880439 [Octopus bimaculoides]|eukprot:XP_014785847.1 PREDICTED: uncharacterized protein LOC106880439 [Octopus bimaculoides]